MAKSTTQRQNVNGGASHTFQVSGNTQRVHIVSVIEDADAGTDHGGVVVKPVAKGVGVLNLPLTAAEESAVVYENDQAYKVSTFDILAWELLEVEVTNAAATSKDVSLTVYRA